MSTRADCSECLLRQQAMDAGHAHVGNQFDGVAHEARGDGGLFGNGQIAGAGADHGDRAFARRCRRLREGDGARGLVKFGARLGGQHRLITFRARRGWPARCRRPGPCAQRSRPPAQGFCRGEDHFGHAGAQGAMVIELGKAEIFKGQSAQAVERVVHGGAALAHFVEQRFD